MNVATILNEDRSQPLVPFCYADVLNSFVCSVAGSVEAYYLFVPHGLNHSEVVPGHPPNVHIFNTDELFTCLSTRRIDIVHDFGYGSLRSLEQLRSLSGQRFHITGDFRMERLADYADTGHPDWGSYDGIVYPAEHARKIHRLYSPSMPADFPSAIIPPSVDFNCIDMIEKRDARSLLGLPQDEVLFLCVADFSPRYGTDLFPIISAFELAGLENPNARLIFGGRDQFNGALRLRKGLLQKAFYNQITFMPNPDWYALVALFAAADVFIHLPDSPQKESPYALLFAIGHKLAIIASEWPSIEPLVNHLQSGISLPMFSNRGTIPYVEGFLRRETNETGSVAVSQATAFDVAALARFMKILVNDEEYRRGLGADAFARAQRPVQSANIAGSYIQFWTELRARPLRASAFQSFKNINCSDEKTFLDSVQPLNGDTVLRLSDLGNATLAGKEFWSYHETSGLLFPPVVLQVLECFKDNNKIQDALDNLVISADDPSQAALRAGMLYHILFCLKRGFLNQILSH